MWLCATTAHRDEVVFTEHKLMNGWMSLLFSLSGWRIHTMMMNRVQSISSSSISRIEHKNYSRVTGFRLNPLFIPFSYIAVDCMRVCLPVYPSLYLLWRIVIAYANANLVLFWNEITNECICFHLFRYMVKFCLFEKYQSKWAKERGRERWSNVRKIISELVNIVYLKWQQKKIVNRME